MDSPCLESKEHFPDGAFFRFKSKNVLNDEEQSPKADGGTKICP
jgi:hypothetical protein